MVLVKPPWTTVLATGAVIVLAGYMMKWRRKNYNKPPYPWTRLPVFGNIFSLLYSKDYAYINFYKTSKNPKYAKVFMIQIGGWDICILNHIDVVREALIMKPTDFAGRPNTFSGELITENKDIIFGNYSSEWKVQRKIAHQALRKFASGPVLEDHLHEAVNIAVAAMEKQGQQPFIMVPFIELLVLNLFSGIIFGKTYQYQDEEFNKFTFNTRKGLEAFGSHLLANIFPWMKWLPFQGRGVKENFRPMFDMLEDQVQQHKKSFNPETPQDIVDYLLLTQLEAETEECDVKGILTDRRLVLTLLDLFGAGIDTMSQVLKSVIGRMAMFPEKQEKLYEEINSAIGDRLPVLSDRGNLSYTEAFLQEVQRLDTGAVLGVPLSTTCDTTTAYNTLDTLISALTLNVTSQVWRGLPGRNVKLFSPTIHFFQEDPSILGNFELPRGTMVMINVWALHHDSDIWEKPTEFRPDRFLDSNGKLTSRPESFIPFSAGKRVCLGDSLARSQLMMILPMLVQRFKFIAPDNFVFEMENNGMVNLPKPYAVRLEIR